MIKDQNRRKEELEKHFHVMLFCIYGWVYVCVCMCVWLAGDGFVTYNTKLRDTQYDAVHYTTYRPTTPTSHTPRSVCIFTSLFYKLFAATSTTDLGNNVPLIWYKDKPGDTSKFDQ